VPSLNESSETQTPSRITHLRTVSQFVAEVPAWNKERLYRTIDDHNDEFIESGVIVREGEPGRILIDLHAFYDWLRQESPEIGKLELTRLCGALHSRGNSS